MAEGKSVRLVAPPTAQEAALEDLGVRLDQLREIGRAADRAAEEVWKSLGGVSSPVAHFLADYQRQRTSGR